MGITHATAATGTDSGDGKISHNAWNEEHTGVTTVATDAIWDAAGDLAVGTGADTAAKLTKGSDGDVLTMVSGAVAWDAPAAGGAAEITDIPTAETDDTLVLAPDGIGGVEFRAEAGGGLWTPDNVPASPSAYDDEFTTTDTSDPMTGWSTLGSSLDALNMNSDFPSHLHLKKDAPGAFSLYGIYKAMPSAPFTVSCKVNDQRWDGNYKSAGLFVAEAAPGKLVTWSNQYGSGLPVQCWNSRTSRAAYIAVINDAHPTMLYHYLRIVVTSNTSWTFWSSHDGTIWSLKKTAWNPADVLGATTFGSVGLYVSGGDNDVPTEATFDWIRFS